MTTSIFETLAACRQQVTIDHLARCSRALGKELEEGILWLPFFERLYGVGLTEVRDAHGQPPTEAVCLVIYRYILNHPTEPVPQGRLMTFRELAGAGPLVSSFTRNTNKVLTSTFAADTATLRTRALAIGGTPLPETGGFDLAFQFTALPGLPLLLHFNAADDLFPAQANILFYHSAERYLDMQGLFILGTYLAGHLI